MRGKKVSRNLVRLCVLVLFLVFSVISVTLWFALRDAKPPQPPEPDLSRLDPEVAEAIAAARDKVRQQPKNGAAWGRLGKVFLVHDFHDEAQRSFEQAAHLDPADGRWPYLRGASLIPIDPAASIPSLERAAELCGKSPLEPRLLLAETLLNQGRLDEAERHLEWARKVGPEHPRVRMGLGRLALLRGQWRPAVEQLEACIQDLHTRRMAHRLLAEAWTRLGEHDKAREQQRQAAEASQDHSWIDPFLQDVVSLQCGLSVRLLKAKALFAQQRPQQAVELLEETARRYPQSAAVWLLLGDIWRHLEQPDRSEKAFAEAVRIDPESVSGWFGLGLVQAARGRPRAAADSFRRTIRLKADHAEANLHLGQCLKDMGDAAGAADAFRAALRCRPDYESAQQALRAMDKKK